MASAPQRISRLPDPSDPILEELHARTKARGGRVLNIHRVSAHAPRLARAKAAYTSALREESSVPRTLQELLILRVAQIDRSEYELSVHRRVALECGVTPAKIEALASWNTSGLFDPSERAMLAFAEQAATGEVDEHVFAGLQEWFGAQQIVELATLIAWYVGNAHFVRALKIEPEQEA